VKISNRSGLEVTSHSSAVIMGEHANKGDKLKAALVAYPVIWTITFLLRIS
jgi:hypothetical protein